MGPAEGQLGNHYGYYVVYENGAWRYAKGEVAISEANEVKLLPLQVVEL